MKSELWKRVDELLQSALEVDPERRDAFLLEACGGDSALLDEVKSLLTSHRRAGDFLETPAAEVAARAIATEEEPSLSRSREGQLISHYRILNLIGRGGMGTVWLAERCDGRFERKAAIKFIHLALLDQASAERFKREGAILGKLAHPQIAELIDAGLTSTGEPFLVLEYVEGQPIDDYCDGHKLSVNARIRLFLEVLNAVAHAHSNLIVHRDIKPSNVLVRNDAQVKLLDFGIAKVLADETSDGSATQLTLEGGAALTPKFAAPEQVTEGTITTATDIYALGVLLFLLLTGQHPAGPGPHSPAQLIRSIVDEEPRRVSESTSSISADAAANRVTTPEKLGRQLRGDLDRIVAKAVKKNPAERYPSASAFADDLQRYLEHKPVLARPDSFGYRTAKFVRRHRVAVAVAATALVATLAGVAGLVIQDRRVRAERDIAFRELVRTEQHDEFLDFLLSDAAPSGKPFTVNDLLGRAQRIVEKQKATPEQVELLAWIGGDYSAQDQPAPARAILERAYQLSRRFSDPGVRASAACTLGWELARGEDLARAEALIQEGLQGLPDEPQYTLTRVNCLRFGSKVSREAGATGEALRRMEMAQQILRASPLDADTFEMVNSLDLASAYRDAGRDREALAEFERAGNILSSLGRDETGTAGALYNNWALALYQAGRPLEAEKIYRQAIDITRDNSTEDAVTPNVLNNYAHVLRELDRLPQAADYAERAYNKAVAMGDELSISQSLLERSRIYLAQHDLPRAESMLAQVEPRMHKMLPPGHYAFASISSERSLIAMENHDLPAALRLEDEGIAAIQVSLKSGHGGSALLPGLYTDRSAIDLALGRASEAEADAGLALAALHADASPGDVSSRRGRAYLAQARAMVAEGKTEQARTAGAQALADLQGALGPDHPDTQSARRLAQ
ncbi:MAG: serine/threonine-protein kinase [Terracidiphilus sp.]